MGIVAVAGDSSRVPHEDQVEPIYEVEAPLDPRILKDEKRGTPVENFISVSICATDPTKTVKVGSNLSEEQRERLITFLREHHDVFALSHSDMSGIPPSLSCHKLNVSPHNKPVKQKRRAFNQERYDAIEQEVDRLLAARFIRKAVYPDWVSNVVLVKKSNGKWRMCVDFTYLNQSCPKDSFPLPRVDQLVDATARHEMLSFMDAFSGYAVWFEECRGYLSAASEQNFQGTNRAHHEVYIDDMITKSVHVGEHLGHLRDTFTVLRRHQMRLNPEKCAFRVTSGKFLGFMVQQRGIEANPDKIHAVLNIKSPRTIKEVQSLAGRTPDCEEAFQELKGYLVNAPLLAKPEPEEVLLLYLAVSEHATSFVLLGEDDNGVQRHIYYTSKAMVDAEKRYPTFEKIVLALKLDMSERLLRWFLELSEFDIIFKPRSAIKAQAIADFIAEFSNDQVVKASNNEAEYEAIIAGLRMSKALGVKRVHVKSDSQLVVSQITAQYQAKEENMKGYLGKTKELMSQFCEVKVKMVPRLENSEADTLANQYGAKSYKAGRLSYRAIEATCRAIIRQFHRAMSEQFRRNGKIWVRVLADLPITRKSTKVRMGRRKGNPTGWIARVSTGQILFEMDDVSLSNARQAATLAAHKPCSSTKFVQWL
ncbi:hypothetical protein WN944_019028 [Citrus x changshan-huyou]|uniref:RNase H type-1 domain-containing protein n=1 Tax=Citrus x changshan-huyou TaxID=2935761 RepID=A0AAP0LXV2_9ROSI